MALQCRLFSQALPVIYVKKESDKLIFFKKGIKSDSIVKHKSDVFYLVVPDSLKKNISLLTENAQLVPTKNDSLFLLRYLYGVKYEGLYLKEEKEDFKFHSLINGASAYEKNMVLIQVVNKKDDEVLIENRFIYVK